MLVDLEGYDNLENSNDTLGCSSNTFNVLGRSRAESGMSESDTWNIIDEKPEKSTLGFGNKFVQADTTLKLFLNKCTNIG